MKLLLLALLIIPGVVRSELLVEVQEGDDFFLQIADALDAFDIDILPNLNHRELARDRIQRPRLGGFPDLPDFHLPGSEELAQWEAEYESGQLGGLVILLNRSEPRNSAAEFWRQWVQTYSAERLLITYSREDSADAQHIANVAEAYGHGVLLFNAAVPAAEAGRYYATAAKRLALDSRAARQLDSEVTELSYLGRRVRRNTDSIFRNSGSNRNLARREPAVFLKESLGDEFSESTVREIIVPGGVALGETAYLSQQFEFVRYVDFRLELVDGQGVAWQLPEVEPGRLKALFDFTARSQRIQSDAIVDIDADGRVRISAALRDTDVGFQIMHADTLPFEYVRNLSVTKSVVIDTGVDWFAAENSADTLQFATEFEVRFLSADNMRLAQTRVALVYEYDSRSGEVTYEDSWGQDAGRLRENLDYAGLGVDMVEIADTAGWVGLLRHLHENRLSFLEGRYEFMQIDKAGQETPNRY